MDEEFVVLEQFIFFTRLRVLNSELLDLPFCSGQWTELIVFQTIFDFEQIFPNNRKISGHDSWKHLVLAYSMALGYTPL